jgi:type I restriction enzyme S subunit
MSSDGSGAVTDEGDHEQRLVPKLRFPEFRDADPWPIKPLGALAKRRSKRNSDHGITRVLTNSAEHGVVDQKDYFEKDIAVQGNLDSYFVVERGDYVYNPRISSLAPVGPIGKNDVGTGVMSPLYTVFRFSGDDDAFYKHYFRSACWHGYLRRASNSGARHDRMAISNDSFFEMPLPAPSIAEQQKIADCLASLDALMAAETNRLAALKDHKNGLMRQLFPAEGDITPRLRFPEFRGAGAWEERPLGSLLKCPPTYGANAPAVPYSSGLPTYLRITDISEEGRYISETKVSVDVKPSSDNSLLHNDIALVRTGASVGKSYLHSEDRGPLVFAGFLIRVRADSRLVLPEIIYQFLQTERYWSWVVKTSARSGQPGINSSEYASLTIPLPKAGVEDELAEQQRIADCLSAVDAITIALSEKIEALKAHKRGLMQQLFPAPHEASA